MAEPKLRTKGLSTVQLKYFATAMMLLDHANMMLRPFARYQLSYPLLSQSLFFLGRMAFPIFAFFVAEGMRHTRNRKAYLIRLGVFGGVTQLPFLLGVIDGSGSIIATFFLAAAGGFACDYLRGKFPTWISVFPLLISAQLSYLLPTDYSWVGVLTVCCVYLMPGRRSKLATLALFMAVEYFFRVGSVTDVASWIAAGMALLSVLLLALCYNGQRGKGNKWFFYWFYPLHLIVLGGLAQIL